MNYSKLLEGYLNKNSHIIDEKIKVLSCTDNGSFIRATIEWESKGIIESSHLDISLFDLIGFVYSKISV